jgi:uncharacterized protein DUF222/HNH endonuclease
MPHDGASICRSGEAPLDRVLSAVDDAPHWIALRDPATLGEAIIKGREAINRLEAVVGEATRRFEKAHGYEADGALGMVPWLREHGKLSGGQAAERVEVARQLEQLPRTEEVLARGEIGYEHAVAMARAAGHVGVAHVRKAETQLLKAAETMDPGRFVAVAKNFEHQVDAEAALTEANRAHERRYFHIGAPANGLVRLEGQVTTEQGAVIRTAIEPWMKPTKGDERTPGQRGADALTQACRRASGAANGNGAGPRVQLLVKAVVETLAKIAGAPAGELEWGGTIPSESVRRLTCDAAITRMAGLGELEHETTHAARTIPPATRRALVERDHYCVFPGCDRPPPWCEGHHLIFWADGGPTKLENLGLVCGPHHRKVHEEGWKLQRDKDGRWHATPPPLKIAPHARSA